MNKDQQKFTNTLRVLTLRLVKTLLRIHLFEALANQKEASDWKTLIRMQEQFLVSAKESWAAYHPTWMQVGVSSGIHALTFDSCLKEAKKDIIDIFQEDIPEASSILTAVTSRELYQRLGIVSGLN